MLIIEGGRPCLYQWDVDQRLEVLSDEIIEVHFVNAVTSPALVCEVYEEDGRRFANVPNILLQQIWPVQAYGCCDCRVREVEVIKVVRREKPADYVYTETEVKTFSGLEARIKELEEHGAGAPGAPGKTAYQYAQDGGYTGTEAEFAQKLAEELPEPYTLPVATADTLGGVKVGRGLVMDGETLGVEPEGEYELIDTVTIEGTTLVSLTVEPDGTPYNFCCICVVVKTPYAEKTIPGVVSVNGKPLIYFPSFYNNSSAGRTNKVFAEISRGIFTARGVSANSNGNIGEYGSPYANLTTNEIDTIKSIRVSIVNATIDIPEGGVIEIWGVRSK